MRAFTGLGSGVWHAPGAEPSGVTGCAFQPTVMGHVRTCQLNAKRQVVRAVRCKLVGFLLTSIQENAAGEDTDAEVQRGFIPSSSPGTHSR